MGMRFDDQYFKERAKQRLSVARWLNFCLKCFFYPFLTPNMTLQALSYWRMHWDTKDLLLLGARNFFDNQTRHWHPSRVTIRVSITGTVSNVDANADIPFSDVVTVALYCSMSEVTRVTIGDPQSCVNRQRTATLGAVESDEPSLAAATATSQIDISLEYNMKSCIVFNFSKLAILKTQHYILLATSATQKTVKYDSR